MEKYIHVQYQQKELKLPTRLKVKNLDTSSFEIITLSLIKNGETIKKVVHKNMLTNALNNLFNPPMDSLLNIAKNSSFSYSSFFDDRLFPLFESDSDIYYNILFYYERVSLIKK